MGLIRIIIWALFFYIIYKLIRTLVLFFMSPKRNQTEDNVNQPKKKKSKVDKKDIIEAEFEEIKDKEKENSQS
ncbi:MAG: hypothetical protein QY331_10240 [Melioribacteraceae bacterium]|jgi:hypothetical protein|nr:MAG: hypothetical protein C4543_01705 [Ignavibacteriales bacterium]WKZ68331.1 MAG: hypothetical protein QY331_10240 [Melioribacteraceae bacterium]